MTDYEKQALDFLESTGTTFKAVFLRNDKYLPDDKEARDIYEITLSRGERAYTFTFGQSISASGFRLIRDHDMRTVELAPTGNNLQRLKSAWRVTWGNFNGFTITEPKTPTPYDVLAALTKSSPGTFKDFCDEYGYDEDSRTAEKTYQAVQNEFLNVERLFTTKEIAELQEIN